MDTLFKRLSWDEIGHVSPWWDMPEPDPGTVGYQNYGHVNDLAVRINQELTPILEQFLYQPCSPQVLYQIENAVSCYFANEWVVGLDLDVTIDVDPETFGIKVTAVINYGRDVDTGEDDDINYGVDNLLDSGEMQCEYRYDYDGMDEALEAFPDTDTQEGKSKKESNADDILYEPVDLEAERNPKTPEPVYSSDYC